MPKEWFPRPPPRKANGKFVDSLRQYRTNEVVDVRVNFSSGSLAETEGLTFGKSRFLQDEDDGKGAAQRAAELCGIALTGPVRPPWDRTGIPKTLLFSKGKARFPRRHRYYNTRKRYFHPVLRRERKNYPFATALARTKKACIMEKTQKKEGMRVEPEKQELLTCFADGIPYRVFREPDLRWLKAYGTVFRVMDAQTSGNLCFGVEGPYGKLFIKFAGALTVNGPGQPDDAVHALRSAIPLYEREHPALVRLLAHGPAGDGYAAIFRWTDAQVLRPTPPSPAVYQRLRHIHPRRALKMLDGVYDLHAELAAEGYIAVDFYDGNLLIDFERDEALVCDIDLYRKKPAVNDRGRMPGSARFMSPEEFTLGAPLNESTTVYAMGALAYAFFGDVEEKNDAGWHGPTALLPVAKKAVSERPIDRHPSLRAFLKAWRDEVGRLSL